MSSRGRKSRDPLDRYDTDPGDVRAFLKAWIGGGPRGEHPDDSELHRGAAAVLEPACGAGNMLGPLREYFPYGRVDAGDIEPRCDEVEQWDFLDAQPGLEPPDLVISNPPFRLAEQFVRQSLRIVRSTGYVVMLLRAGFLETKGRKNFFEQYMPVQVWFTHRRLRFTGPNTDGVATDMALYAWFVWQEGTNPEHFEGRLI